MEGVERRQEAHILGTGQEQEGRHTRPALVATSCQERHPVVLPLKGLESPLTGQALHEDAPAFNPLKAIAEDPRDGVPLLAKGQSGVGLARRLEELQRAAAQLELVVEGQHDMIARQPHLLFDLHGLHYRIFLLVVAGARGFRQVALESKPGILQHVILLERGLLFNRPSPFVCVCVGGWGG